MRLSLRFEGKCTAAPPDPVARGNPIPDHLRQYSRCSCGLHSFWPDSVLVPQEANQPIPRGLTGDNRESKYRELFWEFWWPLWRWSSGSKNQPEEQAVERWTLPGFIENGALAVKTTTDLVEGKIDRIRIERADASFTLQREEGEWRMTHPRRAVVESMLVKSMLLLQKETLSLFSQTLVENDRALYGFDDGVTVELFEGENLFTTFVGDRIQSDDPEADSDEVDTWVMKPESNQIFRMGGKDLRTFDHTSAPFGANDWSPLPRKICGRLN